MAYVPPVNEKFFDQGASEQSALLPSPVALPAPPTQFTPAIANGRFSTDMCDIVAQPGGSRLCVFTYMMQHWQMGTNVEHLGPEQVLCGGKFWGACCLSFWLFVTSAVIGGILQVGPLASPCYVPYVFHVHRSVQKKYGIKNNACLDCLAAWWCPICLTCQDTREIMIRENIPLNPLGSIWPAPPPRR